jgi:hypothetical protein
VPIVFEEVIAETSEEPRTVDRPEAPRAPEGSPEEDLRTFRRLQARADYRASRLSAD